MSTQEQEKAIAAAQVAVTNSPTNYERYLDLGVAYFHAEQLDEALAAFRQASTLNPQDYEARGVLARVYRAMGRLPEADEQYELASEMAQQDNEYGQACFAAVSAQWDQALALLEVALKKGQVQPGWARIDPEFAFICDDPRFQALIAS